MTRWGLFLFNHKNERLTQLNFDKDNMETIGLTCKTQCFDLTGNPFLLAILIIYHPHHEPSETSIYRGLEAY